MKSVLSIQSGVVYGYAGNKAAVLPLQLVGIDVWPFNTVQFSNHTQYEQWQGAASPHGQLTRIVDGLANIDVLSQCSAVLSGYLGDVRQCEEVANAVSAVRRHNPAALYFCDPVMGNPGKGCVVPQGVESFFRHEALSLADIIGPNLYELEVLAGKPLADFTAVITAARQITETTGTKVLVKHLAHCGREKGAFEMLLVTPEQTLHISRPLYRFDRQPVGVGDLTCSLLLGALLNGFTDCEALERTANSVDSVMQATWQRESYELQIIPARQQIMQPELRYRANAL